MTATQSSVRHSRTLGQAAVTAMRTAIDAHRDSAPASDKLAKMNALPEALKAAMAKFGPETPSRWDKVAKAVGTSRSGQQCKKREQWLKKNQA